MRKKGEDEIKLRQQRGEENLGAVRRPVYPAQSRKDNRNRGDNVQGRRVDVQIV